MKLLFAVWVLATLFGLSHAHCDEDTGCCKREYKCPYGEDKCVHIAEIGDGKCDCELSCEDENAPYGKICPDQSTLVVYYEHEMCDGYKKCCNGEDEIFANCRRCYDYEFECDTGNCIWGGARCNGYKDCKNGEDEQNCYTCNPDYGLYRCSDGTCIPSYLVGDGNEDCCDGSDENVACKEDEVRCEGTSRCIPAHYECDGVWDCKNGTDERKSKCHNVTMHHDKPERTKKKAPHHNPGNIKSNMAAKYHPERGQNFIQREQNFQRQQNAPEGFHGFATREMGRPDIPNRYGQPSRKSYR